MFLAEAVPTGLLALRQNNNEIKVAAELAKPLNCTHENRLPCDGKKLLGQLCTHAHTLTTCNDDNVIHDVLRFVVMSFAKSGA